MENIFNFNDYIFEEYLDDNDFGEIFEAKASKAKRTKDGVEYNGEKFPGFNKPKSYKKGVHGKGEYKKRVLAKEGDEIKIVNYGHRDYSDYTKHKDPERRKNFRARHKCDQKNTKLSARYWACKDLW